MMSACRSPGTGTHVASASSLIAGAFRQVPLALPGEGTLTAVSLAVGGYVPEYRRT